MTDDEPASSGGVPASSPESSRPTPSGTEGVTVSGACGVAPVCRGGSGAAVGGFCATAVPAGGGCPPGPAGIGTERSGAEVAGAAGARPVGFGGKFAPIPDSGAACSTAFFGATGGGAEGASALLGERPNSKFKSSSGNSPKVGDEVSRAGGGAAG